MCGDHLQEIAKEWDDAEKRAASISEFRRPLAALPTFGQTNIFIDEKIVDEFEALKEVWSCVFRAGVAGAELGDEIDIAAWSGMADLKWMSQQTFPPCLSEVEGFQEWSTSITNLVTEHVLETLISKVASAPSMEFLFDQMFSEKIECSKKPLSDKDLEAVLKLRDWVHLVRDRTLGFFLRGSTTEPMTTIFKRNTSSFFSYVCALRCWSTST